MTDFDIMIKDPVKLTHLNASLLENTKKDLLADMHLSSTINRYNTVISFLTPRENSYVKV